MKLRDALLDALKTLPGTRTFHLHVLVSAPRKYGDLFPYAIPRPRVDLQDILVLVSEQTSDDRPRILVAGLEASLYHIRQTSSAILNVCKVDTTGHCSAPSPTRRLVEAFLRFYSDSSTCPLPIHTLWIHVFARAQNQYLFPNSSEYSGKHPLTDVKLCAWWKGVFTDVALAQPAHSELELSYVLPGLNETEAIQALGVPHPTSSIPRPTAWVYGHPYARTQIPLPCPLPPNDDEGVQTRNLGHYIPSFDDDPKSRFMDEIAHTSEHLGVKSPKRKRRRNDKDVTTRHSSDDETSRPEGEMGKVTPDEFWERMSFRQECVAGAVTGFFVLGIRFPSPQSTISLPTSRSQHDAIPPDVSSVSQPGQVSSNVNRRVLATLLTGTEYSTAERAYRATDTIESAIKALCEGFTADHFPPPTALKPTSRSGSKLSALPPSVQSMTTNRALITRVSGDVAAAKSNITNTVVNQSSVALLSEAACRSRSPAEDRGFKSPSHPRDTYHEHVYGTVHVSNKFDPAKERQPSAIDVSGVTVLTVRKRKK